MNDVVVLFDNDDKRKTSIQQQNDIEENEAQITSEKSNETVNHIQDSINRSSKPSPDQYRLESRTLTYQDLMELDKNEPRWKYARKVLLIAVFIIFFGLAISCIIYISVGKKCPYKPKLPFWRTEVSYWLDLFAFKDSSNDLIGDFNGLISELDYIKKVIGAGCIILGPIFKGFYSNQHGILGPVVDHEQLDGVAGSMEEFDRLLKQAHKKGLKVVLTIDINSISVDHKWIKEDRVKLMELPSDSDKMVSRYGKPLDVKIGDKSYYSVFGHPFVDLDLTNNKTMKEINNVLNFWMEKGVDGFVVDNVAFLVEETPTKSKTSDNWLQNCRNSQIFSPRNVDVLKQIKQAIDGYRMKTGKDILLAVNSGDTGCGAGESPDEMLMFSKVADVTIIREFMNLRGSKIGGFNRLALKKYFRFNDTDKTKFGLTTATLSMPPYGDIINFASTLLVPGVPIVYYTTELNADRISSDKIPTTMYPFAKNYYNERINHYSGILSHLPMPWNYNGSGFSAAIKDSRFGDFLEDFSQKDTTVEYQLADENTGTPLRLVQQLVSLHKYPAFQWGTIEQIKLDQFQEISGTIYVFTRKAEGYPTFIVILTMIFEEMTLNLTTICPSVIPRLIYPPSKNLPVDIPLPNSEIPLENTDGNFRSYVVSCAA
ncbi:Neutral and basic amino acid transport protein [Schistosoma japonicum]|uniref:Neutral and basic amino acid transport protein n=1 Tax=Schistosoma japonicum TaxID=6182 RepID=A0A4Z2CU47_SCHJA|nr:Neutral and basic amino acid transport protein [Schistosoma japonicum]